MSTQTWTIQGNGFHFGVHGLGQEETLASFPSDSLFAALVSRLAFLGGEKAVTDFMQPFLHGEPPFILTSMFPRAGGLRFYPAPLSAQRSPNSKDPGGISKQLKKVAYLSEKLFLETLAGGSLAGLMGQGLTLQNKRVLIHPSEASQLPEALKNVRDAAIWHIEKRPRVTLGRSSQRSAIFSTGRLCFAPGCGLWFGLRWLNADPTRQALIQTLLADLADAGLGGERSVGFGACHIQPGAPANLPAAGADAPWVSLSRYNPGADEIQALQAPETAYQLQNVGGWLETPQRRGLRRRPLHLLKEGSVLGPLPNPVPGRILDVRPVYAEDSRPLEHAVYRYGLAFKVGIQVSGGKS